MSLKIDLDKDAITGGYQLNISDDMSGYRLAGPKYTGHSRNITSKTLDEHDAKMIRHYLDKHFPLTGDK